MARKPSEEPCFKGRKVTRYALTKHSYLGLNRCFKQIPKMLNDLTKHVFLKNKR